MVICFVLKRDKRQELRNDHSLITYTKSPQVTKSVILLPCIVNRIFVNLEKGTSGRTTLSNCLVEKSFTFGRQVMIDDTHGSGTLTKDCYLSNMKYSLLRFYLIMKHLNTSFTHYVHSFKNIQNVKSTIFNIITHEEELGSLRCMLLSFDYVRKSIKTNPYG